VLGAAEYDGVRHRARGASRSRQSSSISRRHRAGGRRHRRCQPGDRFTEAGASADYAQTRDTRDRHPAEKTTGRTSWESLEPPRDSSRTVTWRASCWYPTRITRNESRRLRTRSASTQSRRRHARARIKGSSAFKRLLGETLRVAAGRVFGYARLDRHRSVVKLVPGLATL